IKLYDSSLLGGDGDGQLNAIEAYNLLSDLSYASKILGLTGGDLKSKTMKALPDQKQKDLMASLRAVFPRAGGDLFITSSGSAPDPDDGGLADDSIFRAKYWDDLKRFDDPKYGGNKDKAVDLGEFTMAIGSARVLDTLFAMYDADHDGQISKAE